MEECCIVQAGFPFLLCQARTRKDSLLGTYLRGLDFGGGVLPAQGEVLAGKGVVVEVVGVVPCVHACAYTWICAVCLQAHRRHPRSQGASFFRWVVHLTA